MCILFLTLDKWNDDILTYITFVEITTKSNSKIYFDLISVLLKSQKILNIVIKYRKLLTFSYRVRVNIRISFDLRPRGLPFRWSLNVARLLATSLINKFCISMRPKFGPGRREEELVALAAGKCAKGRGRVAVGGGVDMIGNGQCCCYISIKLDSHFIHNSEKERLRERERVKSVLIHFLNVTQIHSHTHTHAHRQCIFIH